MLAALLLLAPPTWTLVLGGDVMLNGISAKARPFSGIAAATRGADLAFANLEIPLTTARKPTPFKTAAEIRRRDQFVLKADPRHIGHFSDAGFDAVSLANNHAMDYGWSGLSEMLGLLRRKGIAAAGAGADAGVAAAPVVVRTPGGTRVALFSALAFMSRGALAKCGPAQLKRPGIHTLPFDGVIDDKARASLRGWIAAARRSSHVVVVALHWGLERRTLPTPYQIALARAAVDAGADVIWGHHPHVLQGAERYRGRVVLYSLGNLVSPLPGRTALVRLTFTGARCQRVEFLSASISGGRVRLGSGRPQATLGSLSSALGKRFPHPQAVPL